MANEKAAAAGQGFLTPAYKGPVVGRLESGTIGTVLLAQPGLESRIVDAILHSLGPVDGRDLFSYLLSFACSHFESNLTFLLSPPYRCSVARPR